MGIASTSSRGCAGSQVGTLAYSGRSLIIDPRGEIIADAGNRECLLSAELEVQPLLDYRREFPALADMRLEL